jgi:DNA replication protein DnaC
VVFPRPARHRQTPPAIGIPIRACQAGHRVAFATAAECVARLAHAHSGGRLHDELTRLGHIPSIVSDQVGHIPFQTEAANLFLQLIPSHYERASVTVTNNKPFGRRGEDLGDPVAAAMIDRLVHHAQVITTKGDSHRLKNRDPGSVPTDNPQRQPAHQRRQSSPLASESTFQASLTP